MELDKKVFDKKVLDKSCMITACLIIGVAVFLQCRVQESTLFNTLLLLLGVTSVIHHSRLKKWIINDYTCWFDILIVTLIAVVGLFRYNFHPLWIFIILYGGIVIGIGIWRNLIPEKDICIWHASIHLVFICILLYLEFNNKNLNNKNLNNKNIINNNLLQFIKK